MSQRGAGPRTHNKNSSETQGFGFKSLLFRLHFQNHLTYSEATLNAEFLFCFLPHGQTASCSYGGPDWFPSWPTTSCFPFEFHTKLCSWERPTSHLCPPPREKLGLILRPATFFGPFTFSALSTVAATRSPLLFDHPCLSPPFLIQPGLGLLMPLGFFFFFF